ncbi:MAG TPA: hypothetical protein VFE58_04455 [Tepidisphaeraceae bacterium]|jgi:hypothetical protein|nr:hypothetical protein [Tepidisphaeraceae bacterium]
MTVLITVFTCSFFPHLNQLGPCLLRTTAAGLHGTARAVDYIADFTAPSRPAEAEQAPIPAPAPQYYYYQPERMGR